MRLSIPQPAPPRGAESLPILGIYGIQDRQDGPWPLETHDHGLCRVEGGRVVHCLSLERWSRRKHDNRLHTFIEELAGAGFLHPGEPVQLALSDSFVGRAFLSAQGGWRVEAPPATHLSTAPIRARAHVAHRDLEAWIVPHELAHIGAALPFLGTLKEHTLLIHVDGAASVSCASAWLWREGSLHLLDHGWDLAGPVAGYGTNNLAQALVGHGWRQFLAVPGKLMGLAAHGQASPDLLSWLERHNWFQRLRPDPGPFLEAARAELNWTGTLCTTDTLVQNLAACFQHRFEEAVTAWVLRHGEATGARHLVLSGGGALNIPCNRRLEVSGRFESVFVPPCCSDDGLALGAAAWLAFQERGHLPLHGPFLQDVGAPAPAAHDAMDVRFLAAKLAEGHVVATCMGRGEVGPRALGHRSLLVRPTADEARRVSEEMKGREWYRPVAPIVLPTLAERLFEGRPSSSPLSRFMIGSFPVTPFARTSAPGIVHVDGTARPQVVDPQDGELAAVRDLLSVLWDHHGIPCLVNTSFNRRGEPLVQTLEEARGTARSMGIRWLWTGGTVEEIQ